MSGLSQRCRIGYAIFLTISCETCRSSHRRRTATRHGTTAADAVLGCENLRLYIEVGINQAKPSRGGQFGQSVLYVIQLYVAGPHIGFRSKAKRSPVLGAGPLCALCDVHTHPQSTSPHAYACPSTRWLATLLSAGAAMRTCAPGLVVCFRICCQR